MFDQIDVKLFGVVVVLLFYLALSVGWSDSDESVVKHLGYALLVIAFCLAISSLVAEFPTALRWLLLAIVCAAIINAAFSLYLHFAIPDHNPLPEPRLYAMGRLNNPVVSGLSYGFATILCVYLLMTSSSHLHRALLAVALLMLIIVITLTWTRSVWLALGAGLTVGAITQYPGKRKVQLIVVSAIALTIGAALFIGLGAEILLKRAWSFRPEIWLEFISRTLNANLLFGVGLTSDSLFHLASEPEPFKHPHSLFVSTFYYGGLTGLVMYLLMLTLAAKNVVEEKSSSVGVLAGMCLAYGLTATLVDGNELLVKVNYVWLLIWFPVGLLLARKSTEPSQDL